MAMKTEYFSAFINAGLQPTDVYLPLAPPARADLIALLPNTDDYIFLTLKGDTHMETVKCRNEGGTLIIDRALEGTTAALHHYGTCVTAVAPAIFAVIKDMVCNYNCCADGECPCVPVAFAGDVFPEAHVGVAWMGSVLFTGDTPILMGAEGAPDWMTVTQQSGLLRLAGTPYAAGTFSFSVAATNCNGTNIVTKPLSLTVLA